MQKFEQNYRIRSYETDQYGNMRLVTLMNILQDMADTHAEQLGFGLTFCQTHHITWFGAAYHISLDRLPRVYEQIRVRTWPSVRHKLGAVREFEIIGEDGKQILTASSLWILIDIERRKPILIDKIIPDYKPLEERALQTDFQKIATLSETAVTASYPVRFDDIDLNGHVNNAVYLLWAVESHGADFLQAHTPAEIEISFKKECKLGETVNIRTENTDLTTICDITAQGDPHTRAALKIRWKQR